MGHILDLIEQSDEYYADQQFIPCFEVECEDVVLKNRIESILYCVDTALYPISCDFDCVRDFDAVFEDEETRPNNKRKAIEMMESKEKEMNNENSNGDASVVVEPPTKRRKLTELNLPPPNALISDQDGDVKMEKQDEAKMQTDSNTNPLEQVE